MNDCIFMPLPHNPGGRRELVGWEARWLSLGEGEAELLSAGRGSGWKPVEVPRQLVAREGAQAVWYRTEFPRPDHSGRVVLRIGGAFLATHVWLNGRLLGAHYGYFAPFGFDLTPYLKAENVLAICCESPVEPHADQKRHIMGYFNDGDLKPYPASAYSSLQPAYAVETPVGLWRPVELAYIGSIVIERLRFKPHFEGTDGRLEVEARLRNLDGRQMDGELDLSLMASGREPLRLRREVRLAGGAEQAVVMRLSFPSARRWEPWRFGEPITYRAELTARAAAAAEESKVEDTFAFRDLKWDIGPRRWSLSVNGRPMFLRGVGYAPSCRMDELDESRFEDDIAIAKSANVDAMRVIANVLPHEFYRRADAAGMLVLQELPLLGAYAYRARPEDARFFENAAREQLAEAVGLLQNRPSVVLWSAHDDPPWLAANADRGEMHAVRQNHSLDHELAALFHQQDVTRPALAASGELDMHLGAGWSDGSWKDVAQVEPAMVTAFGAQSLPDVSSPAWDAIGATWPVADEEGSWRHAGFQPVNWAERGVGLPSAHQTFEEYIESSQRYQADLVKFTAEHLRTRKFESCWGAFAHHLIDPFPGIGFGLVDGAHRPKKALGALSAAFKSVRLIVEPISFEAGRPFRFLQRRGEPFSARLVIVNDDPAVGGRGTVRWSVNRRRGVGSKGAGRLRDAVQKKSFFGSVEVEVPTAMEPAVIASTMSLPLSAEGEYRLEAELLIAGVEIDRVTHDFTVTATLPPPRPRPEIPKYLAQRLADLRSLRSETGGMSFALENQTRPAVLTAMGGLRLDGVVVARHQLQIETDAGLAPLPKRLELPVGRRIAVHVLTGEPLATGGHALEADITVPGVASGRLVIEGAADLDRRSEHAH